MTEGLVDEDRIHPDQREPSSSSSTLSSVCPTCVSPPSTLKSSRLWKGGVGGLERNQVHKGEDNMAV